MTEIKRCRCGGEAFIHMIGNERIIGYLIRCNDCGTRTIIMDTESEAVSAWNKAMSAKDINVPGKGKWLDGNGTDSFIHCSVCGHEAYWDTDYGQQEFDFCPYCGADMRGE